MWNGEVKQDQWVYEQCGNNGTFLDLGCAGPIFCSNTYALEQLGWRGLLVDFDEKWRAPLEAQRQSPFIIADATTIQWGKVLEHLHLGPVIDYWSIDLDKNASIIVLCQLFDAGFDARCITIEHDAYSQGNKHRGPQRNLLTMYGYTLAHADVKQSSGYPFEDWWTKETNGSRQFNNDSSTD